MTIGNSLIESDIAHHIHPYTNLETHRTVGPMVIEKGEGIYVADIEGRRYIEGVSGLWSVALGFGEKRLAAAAMRQFEKLPYYHSFTHKAHAPAIQLAAKLAELAPGSLNHVHFTNSGSEANDTVIKMIWYLNNALGRPAKKKFLARHLGYHGATVASGSLTGLPAVHRDFDLPAIPVRHLTCPNLHRSGHSGETEADFADRLIAELEAVIAEEGADTIAAFIGEPVMAAGGVLTPPPGYWRRVVEVCRRHDILVVMDEIITAFGRLGQMFGSDHFHVTPDLMVLSKQLTSSYQPLAAIVVSDEINDILVQSSGRLGSFVHGFTTTGHPVATAVALENIRIIEEDGLVGNARRVGKVLQAGLQAFSDHPLVNDVRGIGLIGGIEFAPIVDQPGALGGYLFRQAHEHGLIIRSIQDTVAFCPPLITTEEQVEDILAAFRRTLADAEAWLRGQA